MRGRTILVLLAAALGSLLLASPAIAGPETPISGLAVPSQLLGSLADDLLATADLSALLDPTGRATQHYGPYPSGSPDSGTCGVDWATDTFDRHFTVKTNQDGSIVVVEQFKNGSFVTTMIPPMNPSPGACDTTDGSSPGTVNAGVTGSMQGYFIIPLPPGTVQTSYDRHCNGFTMSNTDCTTAIFVDSHFTPACYGIPIPTCTVTTFFFHYSAGDQSLVEHEWKNASSDRGGNHGDIRSTNLP